MVCVGLIHIRGALGAYKDNLTSKRKAIKMIKNANRYAENTKLVLLRIYGQLIRKLFGPSLHSNRSLSNSAKIPASEKNSLYNEMLQ